MDGKELANFVNSATGCCCWNWWQKLLHTLITINTQSMALSYCILIIGINILPLT